MLRPASIIVTTRLVLTPLAADDADAMFPVLDDTRMHEFTGGAPLTLDDLRARYRALATGRSPDGSEMWCNWIVRLGPSADPVGVVQATVAADASTADVAWEIGVPWQQRGIASEAAAAVVGWLRAEGVPSVRALVHPDHVASGRIAERAGLARTDDVVDGEVAWRWEETT